MLRNWVAHTDELAEICESLLLQKRDKRCSRICAVAPFRSIAGPRFQPIFSRAGSTQMAEHSRKNVAGS